jgi:hypothetical protein
MPLPTLGLAVAPPGDSLLARFLAVVARWCLVRQADAADSVDAWVVTDNSDPSFITPNVPVLVWTRDPQRPLAQDWPPSAILIGPHVPDGFVGAHQSLAVPEPAVDAAMVPYVPPLVRQRWRTRFGLPSDMVVYLNDESGMDLPVLLRGSALAVGAVAVATGDHVLGALAWGAPTVTDIKTARRLGLGRAVTVAQPELFAGAAHELTQSETRMSELSWAGRRLVEQTFDLAGTAYRAMEAAGIQPGEDRSHGVLSRLNELWASPQTAWSIIQGISN